MLSTQSSLPLLLCILVLTLVGGEHAVWSPQFEDEYSFCIDFLRANMPPRDAISMLPIFVNNTATLALKARQASLWASEIPFDIFLNYVLPYAVVDEPRENWRPLFYETLMPLVVNATSIQEAFVAINSQIWSLWDVVFQSDSTPYVMGPFEVLPIFGCSMFLYARRQWLFIMPAALAKLFSWSMLLEL